MEFHITRIPEELHGYNCKNTRNYFFHIFLTEIIYDHWQLPRVFLMILNQGFITFMIITSMSIFSSVRIAHDAIPHQLFKSKTIIVTLIKLFLYNNQNHSEKNLFSHYNFAFKLFENYYTLLKMFSCENNSLIHLRR